MKLKVAKEKELEIKKKQEFDQKNTQRELLKKNVAEIKKQIVFVNEKWSEAYNILFDNQNQYLKSKVNACVTLEEFQEISKQYGENNQRLLIVNKPIYFLKNQFALVKVAFYRNIEHNSGRFLLLEKVNEQWIIKEYLNEWATQEVFSCSFENSVLVQLVFLIYRKLRTTQNSQ